MTGFGQMRTFQDRGKINPRSYQLAFPSSWRMPLTEPAIVVQTAYRKTVTAAIIVSDGRVLIARRGPNEKLAGWWEFPGGKLEAGETLQECLRRELYEELGVRTVVNEIIAESVFEYEHGEIHLVALKTHIVEGEIVLTVHDSYEWVKPERLLSYSLAPADIPIAEYLLKLLQGKP